MLSEKLSPLIKAIVGRERRSFRWKLRVLPGLWPLGAEAQDCSTKKWAIPFSLASPGPKSHHLLAEDFEEGNFVATFSAREIK